MTETDAEKEAIAERLEAARALSIYQGTMLYMRCGLDRLMPPPSYEPFPVLRLVYTGKEIYGKDDKLPDIGERPGQGSYSKERLADLLRNHIGGRDPDAANAK